MSIERALSLADAIIFTHTGKHLNDLQSVILKKVLQGNKYLEIADFYGCTEGHVKDIAYLLWKLLTEAFGERVTKSNFRAVLERRLQFEGRRDNNPSLYDLKNLDNTVTSNYLPASERREFIGRENAIAHLNSLIDRGQKIIVIQGEGGIGKTTLAQQYLQEREFDLVLELLMAKEEQNIASVESIVEEWLKKDFNDEPGREFGVSLGRLKRHLETSKVGILIDNLEPALDKQGKLITSHRRYVELLRVLADTKVKSVTLITSRDRLCESDITVCHYRLPGLDERAWNEFFHFHQIDSDREKLQIIHKTYGGNAKAMGIICGAIDEDFDGDFNAYWRENDREPLLETDLKNLVASQFDRLQYLDLDAYQLLCRLGCYRDRDIATIAKLGLIALLWDIDINRQNSIVESLKNRSLIEYSKGQYWLHPMIRSEAIERLKASGEWEIVNRKVAEFWTNSIARIVSIEDAIAAWEAYYHYVEIQDFDRAAQVILKSRDNQWGQFLPLGSTLYRMGLLQPVLTAITHIIDKVNSQYHLSELYNILGDFYWITGKIERAIATQEKTIAIATRCLSAIEVTSNNRHELYYLKMLEVDSLLSIGLYNIDLWELTQAASFFQKTIELTVNTAHYRWGQKASVCLALVNSYLGLKQEAIASADSIYDAIVSERLFDNLGRFAYFMQVLGQTYVNAGEIEKALEMYRRAIAFSEESHYMQIKGKTLTGLAEIERCRNNFDLAISYHMRSLELLEKLGAKCDLAEACFQLALTYHSMQEIELSKNYCDRAIQLFSDMKAPKQVEKVTIHTIYR